MYFILVSNILGLAKHETPFLLAHLYHIHPNTPDYELFLTECDMVSRSELSFAHGQYTEHLFEKFKNVQKGVEQDEQSDQEIVSDKKVKGDGADGKDDVASRSESTVLSPQFLQNCEKLMKALHASNFLTINGESGCGKSTVLAFLAKIKSRVSKLIRVYTDESTDLSSLIGNYTCSENIGEFEWKNGPLMNAMTTGSWLVFENFQEVSPELLNSLLALDKNGGLRTESYAGFVKPELGFKIIVVTNYTSQSKVSVSNENETLLKEKTYFVDLNSSDELWATNLRAISKQLFSRINKNSNNLLVFEYISKVIDIFAWIRRDHVLLPIHYRSLHLNLNQLKSLVKRFSHQIRVIYGENGLGESRYLTQEFKKTLLLEVADVIFGRYKDSLEPFPQLWDKIFTAFDVPASEGAQFLREAQVKVEKGSKVINIGRLGDIKLNEFNSDDKSQSSETTLQHFTPIVYNSYSNKIIERLTACLLLNESCLLVGDTGCGKTTISQHVSEIFGKKLYVYNLNQGSDTIDLVGGFKPVDLKVLLRGLLTKFVKFLLKIVSKEQNAKSLDALNQLYLAGSYNTLMKYMIDIFKTLSSKIASIEDAELKGRLQGKFDRLYARIKNVYDNKEKFNSNLAFQFLQGNLISALKNGDWILIDEINLANNEVLQKLLPIIEGQSLLLYEKGRDILYLAYTDLYKFYR